MERTLGQVESALKNLFDHAEYSKPHDKEMDAKIVKALQEARDIDENASPKVKKRTLKGLRAATRFTNK